MNYKSRQTRRRAKRGRSYNLWRLEKLGNPKIAISYLNAAKNDSPEMFLKALRNVAQAHHMSTVARQAGLQRETLYRSLSENGNPTWDTLTAVLDAVGLEFGDIVQKASEGPSIPRKPARSYRSSRRKLAGKKR